MSWLVQAISLNAESAKDQPSPLLAASAGERYYLFIRNLLVCNHLSLPFSGFSVNLSAVLLQVSLD